MLKGHEIEDSARPNVDSTETACVGDLSSKSPASAPAFADVPGNQPDNDTPGALAAAEQLWCTLVVYVAARRSMRLYVTTTRKYDDVARLTSKRLPGQPAAVPIYNARWRTCMLVLDFDPAPRDTSPKAEAQALADVERDAAQAIAWIHECGGVTVVDRSSRGGIHVLVPFAHGEEFRRDHLMPLLTLLASKLPTLDIAPMRNPDKGCITPPGARCKTGGFRQLVGMTQEQAITAFTARSAPRLVANLIALLDPQRSLLTAAAAGDPPPTDYASSPHEDLTLPPSLTTAAPLRAWVHPFLTAGTVPDLTASDGRPWTASHARLSVLEQHAARGWSLARIRTTHTDPGWRGFWAGYADRRDADKRLKIDWSRAYDRAEKRLTRNAEKSSNPSHKPDQLHTGGDGGLRDIRWKLAAARKWILLSGHFAGRELPTALAVVSALAYGMSLGDGQSVAYGGRWVSVAAGLVGEPATRRVLRKLESLDGSPVRFLARWNAQEHTGDRYTLVAPRLDGNVVTSAEWEAYAARIEPVDPVWSVLGLAAWWVFEITRAIEPGPGETVAPTELAAAARVSLSTVHRAVRTLAEHGLVDHGHGWIARTGRTPRRLGTTTTEADDSYSARVARHQEERRKFWEFIDIITSAFTPRELLGYASIDELVRDTPAYNAAVDAEHSPPGSGPPPARDGPATVAVVVDADAEALELLQRELGAVLLT